MTRYQKKEYQGNKINESMKYQIITVQKLVMKPFHTRLEMKLNNITNYTSNPELVPQYRAARWRRLVAPTSLLSSKNATSPTSKIYWPISNMRSYPHTHIYTYILPKAGTSYHTWKKIIDSHWYSSYQRHNGRMCTCAHKNSSMNFYFAMNWTRCIKQTPLDMHKKIAP